MSGAALVLAFAYLVGAIPFGYLAGRFRGLDIRKFGSGNIGATNVARMMGLGWAIPVFALDCGKGAMATLLAGHWLSGAGSRFFPGTAGYHALWMSAGLLCILGHSYSIFLRFRGGKGVATSLGVVLGIYPQLCIGGLISLAVWGGVAAARRMVSLASICAAGSFPLAVAGSMVLRGGSLISDLPFLVFSVLVAVLVIHRHRDNLVRIRAGSERLIGQSP